MNGSIEPETNFCHIGNLPQPPQQDMCYSEDMPAPSDRSPDKSPEDGAVASDPYAELANRGDWSRLHRELSDRDRRSQLGGAELQRLGEAAYMLGREEEFIRDYERAFEEHLRNGRERSAARCGFWIGLTLMFRGEFAQGSGWLTRAHRLVADHAPECAEQGYLQLPMVEQCLAADSPDEAFAHATRAAEIGQRCEDPDLLAIARHLQGRILILRGDYVRGFELLDEAMVSVTSGRLSPIVTGLVYCSVIEICQKFHATSRAREWTSALIGWCAGQPDIVAFTGRCLIHRAEILILDGHWDEAGREASVASIRLQQGPAKHHAGPAFYQKGEVFRLRGQWDEADAAYRAASRFGFDPQPGLALMRLQQGHEQPALSAIRRALQSVDDMPGKLRLLPAAVEITLAVGSADDAWELCETLRDCARQYSADAVRAAAAEATARVLIHAGRAAEALAHIRRAVEILWDLRAPYHLARMRVVTARACLATGDTEAAQTELDEAIRLFRELGARPDEAVAGKLRATMTATGSEALTPRQTQVLRLIASGLTNPEIAGELGLSQRTVDRHVSDILTRLNVRTRARQPRPLLSSTA
ncbi:MAG: helix-turn-helix transcriptional regulator [Mesorhizobium sp.]|nr:MAG: helix-turn-helix transcriptional regulator [Mesorhizobium sp.]